MAKHLSFWIGFFAAALLAVTVALGIMGVAEEQVRQLAIVLFACVAVLVVLLVIVLLFRDRILRALLGRSEVALEDVAGSLVGAVAAANDGNRDAAATHARALVQGGVSWYTWSSFYRWVIGTALGLLLAFGALVGTLLLFEQTRTLRIQTERIGEQTELMQAQTAFMEAQTERLREQTEAAALQNEIMTLGLVSDLRARLLASARRVSLATAITDVDYPLPAKTRLLDQKERCELYLNTNVELTFPPNRSTRDAIAALAQNSGLAGQVQEALFFLLSDDEPAVVMGAVLVLDTLDVTPPETPLRIQGGIFDDKWLDRAWRLTFTDSIVNKITCPACEVVVTGSLLYTSNANGFFGEHNFEIYGDKLRIYEFDGNNRLSPVKALGISRAGNELSIVGNHVPDIPEAHRLKLGDPNGVSWKIKPHMATRNFAAGQGAVDIALLNTCPTLQSFGNENVFFSFRFGPLEPIVPPGGFLDF